MTDEQIKTLKREYNIESYGRMSDWDRKQMWKWFLSKLTGPEKKCPKCKSKNVVMFTSDDDLCNACGHTFTGT